MSCGCGACEECDLRAMRAWSARQARGGPRFPPNRPLLHARALAARLAITTGLPAEEVLELLATGRTTEELLTLAPTRPQPSGMQRFGRRR